MTDTNTIKGFKGFDKDLKCGDFQYKVGEKYIHDGDVKIHESGFHFCENPLDVWFYYPPTSRFTSVVGSGKFDKSVDKSVDKVCCSEIEIGDEITLDEFIKLGVKYIVDNLKPEQSIAATNTGDRIAATNTGDRSVATNTGHRSVVTNVGNNSVATNTGDYNVVTNVGNNSVASNTGNNSVATNMGNNSVATNVGINNVSMNAGSYSVAVVEGKDSVAMVTGYHGKAKGKIGNWIVLTEWNTATYEIKSVKAFKIDGIKIKEDTFYMLKDGKAVVIN